MKKKEKKMKQAQKKNDKATKRDERTNKISKTEVCYVQYKSNKKKHCLGKSEKNVEYL